MIRRPPISTLCPYTTRFRSGVGQPCLQVAPGSVADLLASTDRGEQRQDGLHHHSPVPDPPLDRKSTRLNSSHANISYAVFCLKKKKPLLNHLIWPYSSTLCP